ncbi:hypothetical protein BEN74_01605 [Acinetobacter sp. WCHAc010034]|uniref:hypothetical protein n=1 Tax=Acinetobacter sp. WCHAc010034 TaxID=1879049 RepID=UPI00083A83CF|nr:hypothetical protein [Acinetobacter sp. WCHAc010034]AYA01705.1 hypothetical protein BEN74_01605 [Acinetobacter sp. WCHAc010034]
MNAMEKLKLTKELRALIDAIRDQKGMEKLSSARRLRELIELLGGPAAEAEKNLHDPLLIDAVNVLIAQVNEMVGTAE